jgi:hypothetical protein
LDADVVALAGKPGIVFFSHDSLRLVSCGQARRGSYYLPAGPPESITIIDLGQDVNTSY